MKLRVGSLKTDPVDGYEHLPLVPVDVSDPRVRNHLLLLAFEGESPSSIGGVLLSKKCADSDIGRGFTAALVKARTEEARGALPR